MNRIYQAFGAIAVVIIAVVFIVSFQPGGGHNQTAVGPRCAAEVRGSCVPANHYRAARALMSMNRPDEWIKMNKVPQRALEGLIERELLLQEAKRLEISVTDDDVNADLIRGIVRVSWPVEAEQQFGPMLNQMSMRFTDKNGAFSKDIYGKQVTQMSLLSELEFKEYQRLEATAERVRDLIRTRTTIGENEVKDNFLRESTTAQVNYVRFEFDFYKRYVLAHTDEAVEKWAEIPENAARVDASFANVKDKFATECRVVRHIVAKWDPQAAIEEDRMKRANDTIEEAKRRLAAGVSFADVAKKLSGDGSAQDGGDLGCLLKGESGIGKDFDDALYKMEGPGISDVVKTPVGLHLIELVAIKKGDESVKTGRHYAALRLYANAEAERLAVEGANQVTEAVKGGKKLDEAVKDYLAKLPRLAQPAAAPAPAPEPPKDGDKPKEGDKPKPGDKPKEGDKPKPGDKPKDGDKPKEGDKPKDEKPVEPKPVDDKPAEEENAPSVEPGLPIRSGQPAIEDEDPSADSGAAAFALKNPGDVSPVIKLRTGYAIMQLKEKKPGSSEAWEKERDQRLNSIRGLKSSEALSAYIFRLVDAAKKEIKRSSEFYADPNASASGSPTAVPPAE